MAENAEDLDHIEELNINSNESVQILTFTLDDEVYGADIVQIQEVLEYRKVTRVPRTPDFLLGVINLRGHVVPVIDLRKQFNMNQSEITVNTCIVIVDVMLDGEKIPLGLLADAVKEVIELPTKQLSPPPRIGTRIDTRYIRGIGKDHDDFIIILDLPQVIGQESLQDVYQAVSSKETQSTDEDE